mmetsp:Transcript_10142/g.24817  ORF Transcript_10142/g.24817 Transcript_10142/m.24817 type:complete len:223 (+) Transcript_10142:842-1510(+)
MTKATNVATSKSTRQMWSRRARPCRHVYSKWSTARARLSHTPHLQRTGASSFSSRSSFVKPSRSRDPFTTPSGRLFSAAMIPKNSNITRTCTVGWQRTQTSSRGCRMCKLRTASTLARRCFWSRTVGKGTSGPFNTRRFSTRFASSWRSTFKTMNSSLKVAMSKFHGSTMFKWTPTRPCRRKLIWPARLAIQHIILATRSQLSSADSLAKMLAKQLVTKWTL